MSEYIEFDMDCNVRDKRKAWKVYMDMEWDDELDSPDACLYPVSIQIKTTGAWHTLKGDAFDVVADTDRVIFLANIAWQKEDCEAVGWMRYYGT